MRKKMVFAVFYTTENGADYLVKAGFKERSEAVQWEGKNRINYERPLLIRKISY